MKCSKAVHMHMHLRRIRKRSPHQRVLLLYITLSRPWPLPLLLLNLEPPLMQRNRAAKTGYINLHLPCICTALCAACHAIYVLLNEHARLAVGCFRKGLRTRAHACMHRLSGNSYPIRRSTNPHTPPPPKHTQPPKPVRTRHKNGEPSTCAHCKLATPVTFLKCAKRCAYMLVHASPCMRPCLH